jgi:hypothetical protein
MAKARDPNRLYPDPLTLYGNIRRVRFLSSSKGRPFDYGRGTKNLCCRTCDVIMVRRYPAGPVGMPISAIPLAAKCYKCGAEYLVPSIRG